MENTIKAKNASFFRDLTSVAKRAIRSVFREPEFFIPSLIIPVFFFSVNVGALSEISSFAGVTDFKAFQLPVAIVFAVTGVSRAAALVTDIQNGYFDRLLVSPVNRFALLLGLMIADIFSVILLSIPVIVLGLVLGVEFATGILGVIVFVLMAAFWGLVFTGFPYAIALKTGNPAAVNSSFLLFFPFTFLTTTMVPKEALSGWMATFAEYNPVTYLLEGLRSIIMEGWVWEDILYALIATSLVGIVSFFLAFSALNTRVKQGA
jgi:ABC-2 type transport system permease protein